MIAELSQKGLFYKRKIIIHDTKLVVQPLKDGNEVSVPYEELKAFKENHTTQVKHIKIYFRVLYILMAASLLIRHFVDYLENLWIPFAIALVFLLAYQLMVEEKVWKIQLQKGTYIFINKKDPSEEVVNDFIDQLFAQRERYLRETYLFINKNMDYESQFYNLQWLKKINVISGYEFNKLLKELNILFNIEKKSIGF